MQEALSGAFVPILRERKPRMIERYTAVYVGVIVFFSIVVYLLLTGTLP